MNVRRINDILKLVGSAVGVLAIFGPVFSKPHASIAELVTDLLARLPGALAVYAAGFGTRATGTEYQDVADAKAKASIAPPPVVVVQNAEGAK